MTTATANRRMWRRRMRRAGWLVSGLMEVPGKLRRLLFPTWGRFFWTLGIGAVVSGIGSCSFNLYQNGQPATAEQILAATTGNWCVTELLPRRANDVKIKNQGGVFYLGDLIAATDDCTVAQGQGLIAWRQSEALKKAKAAAGVK